LATKTELWASALEVLTTNNIAEDIVESLRSILEPKKGGAHVDVDSAVERDEDGTIVAMLCSLSGVSLPATADYFYEDKKGEGFGGTGLKRLSIQAEKARKEHGKQIKASKDAIKDDLYAGEIDVATAKQMEADLPGVDYSTVGILAETEEDAA